MKPIVIWAVAAIGMGAPAAAGEIILRSGPAQVALIELFTSEGCSSCPPAERWLGDLRGEDGLWREFVPVAFHVSYWDHLGWRDALASKAFTARQHRYATSWGATSVYTPGFVRNGVEWRPRGSPGSGSAPAETGLLTFTWDSSDGTGSAAYTPVPTARPGSLEVTVALLGGGIVSKVRKGENAGRELHHDFVVLRIESIGLARQESGTFTANVQLPPRPDIATKRQALAVWVSARGDVTPLQAAGGWI